MDTYGTQAGRQLSIRYNEGKHDKPANVDELMELLLRDLCIGHAESLSR